MGNQSGSSGGPLEVPTNGPPRRSPGQRRRNANSGPATGGHQPPPPEGGVALSPSAALTLAVFGLCINAAILGIGVTHGSESEAFLLREGLAFCLLTEIEAALWAVVLVPLWRMVRQLRQRVTRGQVAWAVFSVAFFWVLAWLPWLLVPNATSPLVGESWKTDIMAAGGATVAALAVGGISLVDGVIRASHFGAGQGTSRRRPTAASQQEQLRVYLWLHGRLNRFIWTLGGIIGLATLCIYSLYVGLTAHYGRSTLNFAEIWAFSTYAVLLTLAIFLPTYLDLLAAGRRIRDAYYQLALPDQQDYEELERRRARIEHMLRLNPTSLISVKTVMAISAPFASSAIAMLSSSVVPK
jgi:hypothetical protein